ncbi:MULTISPECIES: hypothetical protein [Acinetobacter calcoaceticus/baumannii complex]|uniref:hypothetical protein n=1 Tax=Acinetobacter calcoaceticus/baumannii complex TaxID=909768 RepID=UPI001B820259|nr:MULTISPECIES: hypothetical protein [Acinetobacter calcoaceticus/baumannii complex]MBR7697415.1 hypothetical protein [Acinetobacter nosocomialis]MDA4983381.1 hypothetical protein [Acinetobacter baumannii]MDV4212777.1 hypothetical protein [Acinetobacter baumannii]
MSNLKLNRSVTPTLTGVIIATALGSFSLGDHANNLFNPSAHEIIQKKEYLDNSFIPKTFTSVDVKDSNLNESLDNLIVNLFEKISLNAKPLEEDLAKLLSENLIDLF